MSGGVDSSCAALILKNRGFEVTGATMRLWNNEEGCRDAKAAADRLGIPHYILDYSEMFRKEVIERFNGEYLRGLTPNPCVDCNRFLKFGAMFKDADRLGCDYIATGHYARAEYDEADNIYLLKKAVCGNGANSAVNPKDQSYVLYNLTQEQLKRVIFPLGGITKEEVRAIADENGIVNGSKPDSQDICFIPDGNYTAFIENYTGIKPQKGKVTDKYGNVLGEHSGMISYTKGQRKGLGIAFGKPMYVIGKNAEENTVIVGENEELYSAGLIASQLNRIVKNGGEKEIRCLAKTRYKQKETPCTVLYLPDGRARVIFDEPQRAVTEGQRVVFYDGETVLGGGVIEKALKTVY